MSAVLFLLLRCLSLLGVWFAANGVAPSIQDLSYCYYHSDHLGSSSLMTDQNGTLVRQQYGYRAFGSERFSLNILPSFTSRFTGQPYDAETGLYYFQSRYYDPELGRFIQPDTIVPDPGSSQSLNRYSYVLNNPLKYIDPTGHVPQPANWNQTAFWNPDLSGRAYFDQSSYWNTSFNPGPSRQWFKTTSDDVGWLGAGYGRDWLGLGYQAGGYRTSELPSNNPDPYAHWDYSRTPTVGETVKAVASVALLAVPGGAPVRIIGATMRVARAAAAARVGAGFAVTRMAPVVAKGTVNANRIAGLRAVDDFIAHAKANGMQVIGREVTFNTPFGARRMDVILRNPETGLVGGVEIKSSLRAFRRFDREARQQFSADRWINQFGGRGTGKNSDIFIDNTIKIFWPAPP